MRGLMRFLMMFGPMIYRQYNKYMANKSRKQQQETANRPQLENQPQEPKTKEEGYV